MLSWVVVVKVLSSGRLLAASSITVASICDGMLSKKNDMQAELCQWAATRCSAHVVCLPYWTPSPGRLSCCGRSSH